MKRVVYLTALFALLASGQQRGVRVAAPIRALPSSEKRYALVVGVDDYEDPSILKLQGAANDATQLKSVLTKYAGFPEDNVIVIASGQPRERRPSRANIIQRLSNVLSQVPKDGLFLFAFSGHGLERQKRAFLLPSDSQLSDDPGVLEQLSVSVSYVRDAIARRGVQQVIVLLDACRNDPGGRADAPNPMSEGFRQGFRFEDRNREVQAFATIYATNVGDRAFEYQEKKRGYFSWALEEALTGKAANERGEVTLGRAVAYLQARVPKQVALDLGAGRRQQPFADISGFQADDLVLSVVAPPVRAQTLATIDAPAPVKRDAVADAWEITRTSTDPTVIEAFLSEYGSSQYGPAARIRLASLRAPASASGDAPGKLRNGSVDISHFAGLNAGDTYEKAISAFGKPTKVTGNEVWFGKVDKRTELTSFFITFDPPSHKIIKMMVGSSEAAEVARIAGNDPLLGLLGKSEPEVLISLGQPQQNNIINISKKLSQVQSTWHSRDFSLILIFSGGKVAAVHVRWPAN